MAKSRSFIVALIGAFALILFAGTSFAIPTLVQFDPNGGGNYSIGQIAEFDWQSDGALVVEDSLVSIGEESGGSLADFTSMVSSAPDPTVYSGTEIKLNIHAQAILGQFLIQDGTTVDPLNYEITVALDAVETALLGFTPGGSAFFEFTDIDGDYEFFIDAPGNADIETGVGFIDGTSFLSGKLVSASGTFNAVDQKGSTFINNTVFEIGGYDSNYIEVDPAAAGVFLNGTTFDTTISATWNTLDPPVVGSSLGLADPQYTILAEDFVYKADSSTQFSAIPEPSTMILLGSGLVGIALVGYRRRK